MRKTGIVKDDKYLDHDPGSFHPESPKRLESIYAMLNEEGMADFFEWVVAQPCNREDLLRVHSSDYVDRVAATAGKGHTALDPDTATSRGSYEAAVRAAGGLCEAISAVVAGDPSEEIINYINEHEVDLVIMGTHGRKGMDKIIFGSVAERVVKLAPVPVMVVNPYKVA